MAVTIDLCLSRALMDTKGLFGPRKEVAASVLVFVLTGGASLLRKGSVGVPDLVDASIDGMIGVAGAWLAFFLWNFVCAPFRIERDRADAAEMAIASMPIARSVPEPITVLELSQIADRDYGWSLSTGTPSSGWQTWDFRSGLQHAANDGLIKFEGKVFGPFGMPSVNAFFRRDTLYTRIERDDWLKHHLCLDIPGLSFQGIIDNFDIKVCASIEEAPRYYDARLTDRATALDWLKKEGAKLRGQSEKLHLDEESVRRERNRVAEQGTGEVPANT